VTVGDAKVFRPFRFGVSVRGADTRSKWVGLAKDAEAMGFSTLSMPNHLVVPPGVTRLAPGPALVLAAEATKSLRIGSFVFDNDFWHPATLAQEIATIDLLCEGRFEFGIGAGFMQEEYQKAGIPLNAGRARVVRMAEALTVIKALLAGGPVSFAGTYYRVDNLEATCKPVQRPHPPILVGGSRPRLLSIAAEHADIISVMARNKVDGSGIEDGEAARAAFDAKIATIREAAGKRFGRIELNTLIQEVVVTNNRGVVLERIGREWQVSPSDMRDSPRVLVGTVQQIRDQLHVLREALGISYITVFEKDMKAIATVMETMVAA
jgi:probable F420-dependent oxidoreductase